MKIGTAAAALLAAVIVAGAMPAESGQNDRDAKARGRAE